MSILNWYKDIYISEAALEKKEKIIWKVDHGVGTVGIYLITISTNEKNLLDIINANLLLQKSLRKTCPMIVGIANGYEEAVRLVVKIIDDMYRETGCFKIREYLNNE
jgi:hypothetical protein